MNQPHKHEFLFMSAILCITLLATIYTVVLSLQPEPQLRQTLDAVQSGDVSEIKRYLSLDELAGDDPQSIYFSLKEVKGSEQNLFVLFSSLDYEIVSVNKQGDSAVVRTKIETLDMPKLIDDYFAQGIERTRVNAFKTGFGAQTYFSDYHNPVSMRNNFFYDFNEAAAPRLSRTVDIRMKQTSSGWKVTLDAPLRHALSGGFVRADGRTFDFSKSVKANLYEAYLYAVGEMWTDIFCDFNSYISTNQRSINGGYVEPPQILQKLEEYAPLKASHDEYVDQLDAAKYGDVIASWRSLSKSLDQMSALLKSKPGEDWVMEMAIDSEAFASVLDPFEKNILKLEEN